MRAEVMRRFWAVCRECGLSGEDAHGKVFTEFGYESIKELTDREALYIIDSLLGKECRKPLGRGVMSQKQRWLIEKLAEELGWKGNPERLRGFIKKYTGCEFIDWLSAKQASSVIEGLKRLTRGMGG